MSYRQCVISCIFVLSIILITRKNVQAKLRTEPQIVSFCFSEYITDRVGEIAAHYIAVFTSEICIVKIINLFKSQINAIVVGYNSCDFCFDSNAAAIKAIIIYLTRADDRMKIAFMA